MPTFAHRGHRLYYREAGQGPLLLILPGNTASSAHHSGELAYFGGRYHAVVPDYWGTGGSERCAIWPDDWYEQVANDASALVAHLGEEKCCAMGTSGGGVVALLMAARHAESVRAVVADSCAESLSPEALRRLCVDRARRTPGQVAFWHAGHGNDWEQVVEADTDMLLRRGACEEGWFGGQLASVSCPVLLTISLMDDLLSDPGGEACRLVRRMPSSRAVIFPSGGHPLMWSRPDAFRGEADHFLASLP